MATGIAFPIELDANGQLKIDSDYDLVYDHVLATLQTEKGERLGLINFGLDDYLFSSYFDFLKVGNDIRDRLEAAVPEASFNVLAELGDDGIGKVQVNITYADSSEKIISLEFS